MATDARITDLLRQAELAYSASEGAAQPVVLDAEGRDVFVISDLHLAEGVGRDQRYGGTENFFADASFARFLDYAEGYLAPGLSALLIINGDFVDFMRIVHVPEEADLGTWAGLLAGLGIQKSEDELAASISDKEREHGLKTHDFKSVWKLATCVEGHADTFEALADWLGRGHRLVVVRGNHDLEWYWPAVRSHLRLALAERIAAGGSLDVSEALEQVVLPNLRFIQDAALVDDELYIEHGHQFDKFTAVVDGPVLKNGEELNIPFGSFFNRYLINHVELHYPFLDNIRPRESLLPLLVRERFFLALRLLFQHIPFALRIIPKQYYRYIFGRVLVLGLAVGIPVGLMVWQLVQVLGPLFSSGSPDGSSGVFGFLAEQGWNVARQFAWLALSYFLARVVAYFQLESPSSLASVAREQFAKHDYRFVTFGHTHNPDQVEDAGRWFYNTGTWVPIIALSNVEVRHDKTYTFLHLGRDASGKLVPGVLQRWDDAAGRAEPMTLVRPKA